MKAEDDIRVDHVSRPPSPARNSEIQLPRYRRHGEPERYRLSAARLAMAPREPPTKLVVSVALRDSSSARANMTPRGQALLVPYPLRLCACFSDFRPASPRPGTPDLPVDDG